jgi:Fe-S cluster biogenesis protein NfuA
MDNLKEKVIKAIEEIRPGLQEDGGDIEFISIEEKKVTVELQGACHGCPMAQMTLKQGVQEYLRDKVDKEIEVVSNSELANCE